MDHLIGIDIGTTNTKIRLYDRQGVVLEEKSIPTPFYPDQHGGVYAPEEIAEGVIEGLKAMDSTLKRSVAGLSVSSFAEVVVGLGRDDRPALSSLAFFDTRTGAQFNRISQILPTGKAYQITGVSPYHIYSLYKLLWHRETEPDRFRAVTRWTSMAGYLLFYLGGDASFDPSLASRTMLYNQRTQEWDPELLELAGITIQHMAPLVPSGQVVGTIHPELSRLCGLPESMVLVSGGHDHLCAALAAGVNREGNILISTGTTESLTIALETIPSFEHAQLKRPFSWGHHVVPGRYYAMHGIFSGGYSIDWGLRLLGEDYSVLDTLSLPVTDQLPLFFPYLLGADYEGARGAFLNLEGKAASREVILQGLVAGLCFEYRNVWEEVIGTLGLSVNRVTNVGGASRNHYWMQMKSSVLGYDIVVAQDKEGSAKGAALLAGLGCGVYRDAEEAYRASFREEKIYTPLPGLRDALEPWYELYCELLEDVQRINRKMTAHREKSNSPPLEGCPSGRGGWTGRNGNESKCGRFSYGEDSPPLEGCPSGRCGRPGSPGQWDLAD